jgi:signal transduction histidine kinase/ActR/RegA family two-component response regulator
MGEAQQAADQSPPKRDLHAPTGAAPDAMPEQGSNARIDAEVRRALVERLLAATPVALLAHVVLALLVAGFSVPSVPLTYASAWAVAVAAVAGAREYWGRWALRSGRAPAASYRGMRAWVALHALLWGFGAVWLVLHAPFVNIALMLIVLAGLVAGGMVTLMPDPPSFAILLSCVSGLPALALIAGGLDHDRLAALVLVLVFAGFESAVYRRAYGALLEHERGKVLAVRQREHLSESLRQVVRGEAERRTLEEQLWQAQKMEAIGQLAGGVAHDFNNLLTTVMAANDLLAADARTDGQREDTDLIRQAARRGAELTSKLLAFSRRKPLEPRPVFLDALLIEFYGIARRIVPEDVEIELDLDAEDTVVRADPVAVQQILMNLVTNARDAMPGQGTLTLKVGHASLGEEQVGARGSGKPGTYGILEVADTGAGMDAETRRRVFDPFFTTKTLDQHSGLGMAVVYGLVEQHGAFVEVDSEVGKGTAVRVYFQLEEPAAVMEAEPEAVEVTGGSEFVLLVEDDASLRRAAKRVLEKFGYAVHTATDGSDALDYMRSASTMPDLVISDVVMPRVNGPQMLQAMREAGWNAKVLFTSGYTARAMAERATVDPGLPFLPKPWTASDLLRRVRAVLDRPGVA